MITTYILPLITLILGYSLHYVFTKLADKQKHYRYLRTKAYIDFLRNVSEQANLGYEHRSQEFQKLTAGITDAKARICLYGSSDAVVAFAKFSKLGSTLDTLEERIAFANMVAAMRKDSASGRNKIEYGEIADILLPKNWRITGKML